MGSKYFVQLRCILHIRYRSSLCKVVLDSVLLKSYPFALHRVHIFLLYKGFAQCNFFGWHFGHRLDGFAQCRFCTRCVFLEHSWMLCKDLLFFQKIRINAKPLLILQWCCCKSRYLFLQRHCKIKVIKKKWGQSFVNNHFHT